MRSQSSLDQALMVWHMHTADNLTLRGAVQSGVALSNRDREASIVRGGNAQVAVFEGGYIRLGTETSEAKSLQGDAMSLGIRLRDVTGNWNMPLFSRDDAYDPFGTIVYGTDGVTKPLSYTHAGEQGPATPYYHLFVEEGGPQRLTGSTALLEYRWRTQPTAEIIEYCERQNAADTILADARNGVLTLNAPVAMLGSTNWHDIVFRFAGCRLELFVDGVLIDEEWGYGSLCGFQAPFLLGAGWIGGQLKTGFRGQVDHVALWDRALKDGEISQLSGGERHVAQRAVKILGPEQPVPNYWRPRGYNTYAGDCMLLWDNERLHLFYLFDRRHHTSKWYLGAHQYAHFSTNDLIHWEPHPLAVPLDQPWECAIGTGDFICHDGEYTAFFTDCGGRCQFEDKPHQGSGIFCATSSDGIHYNKDYRPIVPTSDTNCADCSIFQDPATCLFHLLTQDKTEDGSLIIAHYISTDMSNWTRQPKPFLESGIFGPCPHLFYWNAWYYFAMINRLWKSRSIEGPWERLQPEPLIQLNYPKTAAFKDNRFITAGWIGHGGWGGDLVFRELIQHRDGSLGTKFVPEMIPASGPPLTLNPVALDGKIDWEGICLKMVSIPESAALLTSIPANVRLMMQVESTCDLWQIGLLNGAGQGINIQFDGREQQVTMVGSLDLWSAGSENPVLGPITCLDRPFLLDLIVKNGVIDLCLDQQHTLIARRKGAVGSQLRLAVKDGSAIFSDITVRPLT